MIKGNFNVKKVQEDDNKDQKELEEIIEKSGAGSHMVFKSDNDDDELFIDDL